MVMQVYNKWSKPYWAVPSDKIDGVYLGAIELWKIETMLKTAKNSYMFYTERFIKTCKHCSARAVFLSTSLIPTFYSGSEASVKIKATNSQNVSLFSACLCSHSSLNVVASNHWSKVSNHWREASNHCWEDSLLDGTCMQCFPTVHIPIEYSEFTLEGNKI